MSIYSSSSRANSMISNLGQAYQLHDTPRDPSSSWPPISRHQHVHLILWSVNITTTFQGERWEEDQSVIPAELASCTELGTFHTFP